MNVINLFLSLPSLFNNDDERIFFVLTSTAPWRSVWFLSRITSGDHHSSRQSIEEIISFDLLFKREISLIIDRFSSSHDQSPRDSTSYTSPSSTGSLFHFGLSRGIIEILRRADFASTVIELATVLFERGDNDDAKSEGCDDLLIVSSFLFRSFVKDAWERQIQTIHSSLSVGQRWWIDLTWLDMERFLFSSQSVSVR